MDKLEQYFGIYYIMGLALEVKPIDEQLVATMQDVPAGFEILLEPTGEECFRMRGGPFDRSTVTFTCNADGEVSGLRSGPYDLAKITRDDLKTLPVAERLLAPEYEITPIKRASFDALLQSCLERSAGGWIDYALPYPKHEFVQYVSAQDVFIFHGSNDTEIATFEPVRKSVELHDETGRGNLQAVYGTHDGLWAMFFAVVDRARQRGSIRNGVMYFHHRDGEQISVYNFSINQEQLAERPYTEGALYFLPRDTFVRLKLTAESYANEWASKQPVQPYAKLLIQPVDFPFLEQIGGHDDGELVRLATIAEDIRAAAMAASLKGDRFEVTLPFGAEVLGQLDEYTSALKGVMPAADFEVKDTAKGVTLVISSLPPGMQHDISESYRELLSN